MKHSHYNVAPRYTCGSPAMVPERIARHVAQEEFSSYWRAAEWTDDPDHARAKDLGVAGIVEHRTERANGWEVLDLITDAVTFRPFAARELREHVAHCPACYRAPERKIEVLCVNGRTLKKQWERQVNKRTVDAVEPLWLGEQS